MLKNIKFNYMNSKIILIQKRIGLSTAVIFFSGISFAQAQETKPVKDSTSDKQIEEVVLVRVPEVEDAPKRTVPCLWMFLT